MVNTRMFEFKHPKYYTELRKRNKSDQAISLKTHDGECERAPDPGHKLPDSTMVKQRASSSTSRDQEPQASSSKPQAPSIKLSNQPEQATSRKLQAPSNKRQA